MVICSLIACYFALTQSCNTVGNPYTNGCDNYSFQSGESVSILGNGTSVDYYSKLYASRQFTYTDNKIGNCNSTMEYMKLLVFSNSITWVDTHIQITCSDNITLHLNTISTRQEDEFGNAVAWLNYALIDNVNVTTSYLLKIYNDIKKPVFELSDVNGFVLNKVSTFEELTYISFMNNISSIVTNSTLDIGYTCHNCLHTGGIYSWVFVNRFLKSISTYLGALFTLLSTIILLNLTVIYTGSGTPILQYSDKTRNYNQMLLDDLKASHEPQSKEELNLD